MNSSASKRPASFSYGHATRPTSLPTPEPSPNVFMASATADSHPSPLLLPTASIPTHRLSAASGTSSAGADPSTAPAAPKSKSKAATAKSQRKINHSIIEKRRREKINGCLAELRELVPADGSDGSGEGGDSKGEFKLEILVRTVDYVKELQRKIRRLETSSASLSSSPGAARTRRTSASAARQSPWEGIETESEGGLSPGPSDMSIDEAEDVDGREQAHSIAAPVPPTVGGWAPSSLPSTSAVGGQMYGRSTPQHPPAMAPAHLYARQSAPAFVPIGLQRLPSIASMLPPSSTSSPGAHSSATTSSSAGGYTHVVRPGPQAPHLARSHASFSSFSSLPGARANFHLRPSPPPTSHAPPSSFASASASASPTGIAPGGPIAGGRAELRAAEVLLAISSPELRGLAGGPGTAADDELEDWSLGGRLLGA